MSSEESVSRLAQRPALFEYLRELIRRDGYNSTANGCFKEAAELAATLEQYPRAIKHFEAVASASLSSALTRYSVKDYYMKAGMCWLATGVSADSVAPRPHIRADLRVPAGSL